MSALASQPSSQSRSRELRALSREKSSIIGEMEKSTKGI